VTSSAYAPPLAASRPTAQPTVGYDALSSTGLAVELRPYAEGDAPAVRTLLAEATERSSYHRFFTVSRRAGEAYVELLADPENTCAAVVVVDRGSIVAIGSLHPCSPAEGEAREAEFGLLVADERHGDGLGTLVLEDLLSRAHVLHLDAVVAVVMSSNRDMIRVFQDSGFVVAQEFDSGEVRVRCAVTAADQAIQRVADRQCRAEVASLDHVLAPASIAVVGAGQHRHTVGRQVLDHLLRAGFTGRLYAVNPQALPVGSVPGFANIREIGDQVDLVVVAVHTDAVPSVARDCAASGVRAVLALSAGFGEVGEAGRAGQAELLRICRDAGMRLVGPNCIGVANTDPEVGLDATFLPESIQPGATGVLSQSGAAAVAVLEALRVRGAGVSSLVTVGNKADIGGNDVLPWWQQDSRTKVIAAYLESIAEPVAFARLAATVAASTPIVLLKAGRTPAAAAAASSHTAAAADDDAGVDALCRKANIVRVDDLRGLADVSALAGMQPLPRGSRVAIVGNSGGPAVLAADACANHGLEVARLGSGTQEQLRALLPPTAAVGGPVDVTAAASPAQLAQAMHLVACDPGVDVVVAVLTVLGNVPGPELVAALDQVCADHPDTTMAACVFGAETQWRGSVPHFEQPEDAVGAIAQLHRYVVRRDLDRSCVDLADGRLAAARDEVNIVLAGQGEGWMPAPAAYRLLHTIGIESAAFVAADDAEAAADGSRVLTFPVVVKGDGPELVHKSDLGAVRLGLTGPDQVRAAVRDMASTLGARLRRVIVQTQVSSGVEIIVGATRDARFGPLVMIGRGGVDSDVDPDRCWAMAPLDRATAEQMIGELRCHPSLGARRGRAAADLARLADVAVRVSRLIAELPEITEIDLNPVLVRPDATLAVDVRVRVRPAPAPVLLDHVRHLR
jgi:acyl-CoA synthetase (NDP forming)/RimJ/RimL family protein N-acetyltransferase